MLKIMPWAGLYGIIGAAQKQHFVAVTELFNKTGQTSCNRLMPLE
jgi:hypothetical protein